MPRKAKTEAKNARKKAAEAKEREKKERKDDRAGEGLAAASWEPQSKIPDNVSRRLISVDGIERRPGP